MAEVIDVTIEGERCKIINTDLGHGIKSTTITTATTYDNFHKSTDNAKVMDYDTIKEYVRDNFDRLCPACGSFQIQILTREGWSSNKARNWTPDIFNHDFFDDRHFNISGEDHEIADVSEIYAIQIIQLPETTTRNKRRKNRN